MSKVSSAEEILGLSKPPIAMASAPQNVTRIAPTVTRAQPPHPTSKLTIPQHWRFQVRSSPCGLAVTTRTACP